VQPTDFIQTAAMEEKPEQLSCTRQHAAWVERKSHTACFHAAAVTTGAAHIRTLEKRKFYLAII
jgi:hypothetical protein